MTDPDTLVIRPLDRRHDRTAFSCGLPELDRYLSRQAGQDVRRRIARVFVCTDGDTDAVLGFYTLSALSIELTSLPETLSRKLPRHPVPCALVGRLAVDSSVHGRGLGAMLLADAVRRVVAASETVAMHALVVDAANNSARRFYEGFGFAPLRNRQMRLFLPLGHPGLRGPDDPAQT
ncbi:MAG: GNAT family N-acetyltransferase [Rhodospirillaceae bacterium]|nr:GNAT family N-acetyltransferase [Rhodospirillaceae bacterium]